MIILFWILTAAFMVIDRLTKAAAEANIGESDHIRVITAGDTDILAFSLHKNTGAAFSSFTGKTVALAAVTAIALVLITIYFHRQKHKHPLMTVSYAMIVGGGIGNLYDRIFQGYVTDFIRLFPFNFIFNFADICVVIGAILLIAYYLFIDEKYLKKFAPTQSSEVENDK
ncbi:MAG: signal peptidase II [Huintestinicola sp.]|uniref:signal peptidase II n=1 Tax=Huintestinicola sp. TaxID=2981661 RepID=UPI003F0CE315